MRSRTKPGVLVQQVSRFAMCSKCSLDERLAYVLHEVRTVIVSPFSICTTFSFRRISPLLFLLLPRLTRFASTLTDAISLTMTAMRNPWSGDCRMCRSKVVFPLPYCCQSQPSHSSAVTYQKSGKNGHWERLSLGGLVLRLHLRTAGLSTLRSWHRELL